MIRCWCPVALFSVICYLSHLTVCLASSLQRPLLSQTSLETEGSGVADTLAACIVNNSVRFLTGYDIAHVAAKLIKIM